MIDTLIQGAIATVIMNRPEKMNALDRDMWRALGDTFLGLSERDDIGCIVLRGVGMRAFAPGADISEFDTCRRNADEAKRYDVTMRRAFAAVRQCPQPVVALIFGPCVGGGLELACQCDLRISAESGRFGVPINRISVVMAHDEIAAIQRLVGPARMSEILLEGRVFGAREALAMGLVNRVMAESEAEAEAYACAQRITAGAPLVNRWHKRFVETIAQGGTVPPAESAEAYDFLDTQDYLEGVAAFKAKRKPVFTGQ